MKQTKQDLLREIGKLNKKIEQKDKQIEILSKSTFVVKSADTGNINIKAIGSAKITNPKILRFSFKYFEKLIKVYKMFFVDEKDRFDIIFNLNQPLMIGTYDKEKETATGFMLAPKIVED